MTHPTTSSEAHARQVLSWVSIDYDNAGEKINLPTISGCYRVLIAGDSESVDGHTIYEFGDYETWMDIKVDEDGVMGSSCYDEDFDSVIAWCGPFVIPGRKK